MQAFKLTLRPETAFGTPLVGDTLFGHICWGVAEQYGEAALNRCLAGYTAQQPFLVVSDAFPAGYLPLPTLPSAYWQKGEETDRKELKKRQWLPIRARHTPYQAWQQQAQSQHDIAPYLRVEHSQPHNSLNRQTHTTEAGGQFSPYTSEQIWYAAGSLWEIYFLLDETRLNADDLRQILHNTGLLGYGRDASTGLGKFSLTDWTPTDLFQQTVQSNAVWTLAPCCPQNQGFDAANSFYHIQTRFGRHGNLQATAGNPFKQPVLMAQTGAVFAGVAAEHIFVGQGISGISASQPQAVHQGYAPVLRLPGYQP